ncbi:MAG: hypothetical protein U1E76_24875 [Planctomycetota bacterium]
MWPAIVAVVTLLGTTDVPFEKLAQTFREKHAVTKNASDDVLQDVIARDYASLELGLFELCHPAAPLVDAKQAKDLLDIAAAILDLQREWLVWVNAGARSETEQHCVALGRWLRALKPGALAAAAVQTAGDRDLLVALKADAATLADAAALRAALVTGSCIGLDRKDARPVRLVLEPTRADFLCLASFVGTFDDAARELLWVDSLPVWTEFRRNSIQVLALEYGVTPTGKDDLFRGTDMNGREGKGLLQHVTQKAADLLLREYHGASLDPSLELGLAINMVIELYGENNARAGGSGSGSMTSQYSKFVAGGKSSGGQLARRNADSRFRESKGRDHFVAALRTSQRQGAELAAKNDKSLRGDCAWFALSESSAAATPTAVRAPFLCDRPDQDVPANLRNDYLEFLRAYKSAFAHWLETKAVPNDPTITTADAFARMLRPATNLADVYGAPLSSADPALDTLETRFLKWLAKQK